MKSWLHDLGDNGVVKYLTAVFPSMTAWGIRAPVDKKSTGFCLLEEERDGQVLVCPSGVKDLARLARFRDVIGDGWRCRIPAPVRRRSACKDAGHHVKGQWNLRETDPYVQQLLKFTKATHIRQNLIKIHWLQIRDSFRSVKINFQVRAGVPRIAVECAWRGKVAA